jgi:hypothetical protein
MLDGVSFDDHFVPVAPFHVSSRSVFSKSNAISTLCVSLIVLPDFGTFLIDEGGDISCTDLRVESTCD